MNVLLILIVVFVLLEFTFSSFLSYLNGTWMGHPIPEALQDIYDAEKYSKQQRYMKTCKSVSRVERLVNVIVMLSLLVTGVFGRVDHFSKAVTPSPMLQLAVFFTVFHLFSSLLGLPFSHYSTFVIEEKFGFNKITRKTFWLDTIKSAVLGLVVMLLLVCLIYYFYELWGKAFWIWSAMLCCAVIVFFNLFYSTLIVPLFNKQMPLEPGPLRDAIEKAASVMNFKMGNIYVINGSKHSTKANAYFTGFGPKKRIVLYDTLIEQLSVEEIVAVLAHEMGHYKHHDTFRTMFSSFAFVVVYLFVFSFLVGNPMLPAALGGRGESFALSMLAFSLLLTPLEMLLEPLMNVFSRRAEYRADAFASQFGHGDSLVSGLKKLCSNTLSNLTPHPLVVWYTYSHPTLLQRILAIKKESV